MRAPAAYLPRTTAARAAVVFVPAAVAGFVWLALQDRLPNAFHPHGYCYLWDPALVGLLVASDLSIWLSYTGIAITLAYFVSRGRKTIPFGWVFLAFGGFIIACGATHLMDVVTLWRAVFWLAADVKLLTAVASVATAVALPPLVPKVLALVESARLSEQRKLELEQAARIAKAEESKFRTALESSPDGMLSVGTDGRILLVNSRAEALFGYDRRDLLGNPVEMLLPEAVPGARHAAHRGDFGRDPRERPMGGDRQVEARRRDGTSFPAEITLSPIETSDGGLGVVVVVRDITERRKAEEQQAQLEREKDARAEAEAANRAKDELFSVVSHELRSPLNAILGWSALIRGGSLPRDVMARALEAIERNAQAQRQVIDDLLDVSTIVAGRMTLDRRQLDVGAVVAAAVEAIRPLAEARHVRIEFAAGAVLPSVDGDSFRLRQAFGNLLSNAVKFTPAGGEVRVSVSATPSHLRVDVSDTGIGIEPEFLPRVFDRFRQRDSSTTRAYGGLGLGLALVRNLVEAHDGSVQAHSEGSGKGAVFSVILPVHRSAAEADAIARSS